jgi:hypothetical protein
MVIASLIFTMTASAPLIADDGSGTEPVMRQTHLPPIAAVMIRNSGVGSQASGEAVAQCADFKLSDHEIRAYISKAAEVAEHDYFHMLDWSPCYASGEVTFKNGITGIWTIQQYRAGSLKLSNGKTLYLYCPRCRAKAFPSGEK